MKNLTKISILGLFVATLMSVQPKSAYAVDIIYWTDQGSIIDVDTYDGKIYKMNTDGTGFQTIVGANGGAVNPIDVVVDNRGEYSSWKIYWAENWEDVDDTAVIMRANYDGSNPEAVWARGFQTAGGLDIDLANEALYISTTIFNDPAGDVQKVLFSDFNTVTPGAAVSTSILTAGVLAGLNPDPSGVGFVDFIPDFGFGNIVAAADGAGLLQEILIGGDTGFTFSNTEIGSDPGDPITTNSVVSAVYDLDSNQNLISFSDANDTIFFGGGLTNNDYFFSSGLTGTYTLMDVAFDTDVTSGATAYILVNGSATLADGVYRINYNDPPTTPSSLSLLYASASPGGFNYSGMTIVNPELPPGMLGYLAMMLSFMVVWLRSRFHFHH